MLRCLQSLLAGRRLGRKVGVSYPPFTSILTSVPTSASTSLTQSPLFLDVYEPIGVYKSTLLPPLVTTAMNPYIHVESGPEMKARILLDHC